MLRKYKHGVHSMNIHPIRTEQDYKEAIDKIEQLLESPLEPGTPEGDLFEVLTRLVEAYEEEHYPIPLPGPIDAIEYYMETRGLTRKDLEPFIGGSGRVSEILNCKRKLTLQMIRKLNAGLGISVEVLVQPYGEGKTDNDKFFVGEPPQNDLLEEYKNLKERIQQVEAENETLRRALPIVSFVAFSTQSEEIEAQLYVDEGQRKYQLSDVSH